MGPGWRSQTFHAEVRDQSMPRSTALRMAARDAVSSWRPPPNDQPPPPIAQAPKPTRVISRSLDPSGCRERDLGYRAHRCSPCGLDRERRGASSHPDRDGRFRPDSCQPVAMSRYRAPTRPRPCGSARTEYRGSRIAVQLCSFVFIASSLRVDRGVNFRGRRDAARGRGAPLVSPIEELPPPTTRFSTGCAIVRAHRRASASSVGPAACARGHALTAQGRRGRVLAAEHRACSETNRHARDARRSGSDRGVSWARSTPVGENNGCVRPNHHTHRAHWQHSQTS
jgi:hypothetical protein